MNSRFPGALRIAFAVGLTATTLGRAASGQGAALVPEPAAAPTPDASALVPPRLVTLAEAIYPAAAKAARLGAAVDLALTVDATGKVTDARVLAPAGNGFDEAAVEAAGRFVFEPAKRGDRPIPSRIKYRYVFEPAPEAPTTGRLEGKVLERGTNRAVAGAAVTLEGEGSDAGQTTRTAITDAAGAFLFAELPAGRFHVRLSASDLAPILAEEDVSAGDLTSVTYRLDTARAPSDQATLEYGATATVEAPPREVTKRSLTGDELLRVAGTRGDPLRAIEYMPGVGRSPQAEFIIIRGSSPADSEVQVEGASVFRLYHFGGLTSFVQPRLLEKIDLYPGNFSARFGRRMGGIVDVGIRDPRTDSLHAMLDVNIVDSSFLLEGPLSKRWSFAVAAKRSYIDLWLGSVLPKEDVQITAAPVYWDYQAMIAYKNGNDRVRAMLYGSYDDLKLLLVNPVDADPAVHGRFSSQTSFHRAQLTWQHQYSASVEHEINATAGPVGYGIAVGQGVNVEMNGYQLFLRSEWRARVTDSVRLIGGVDVADFAASATYDGPRVTQLDGDPDTFGSLTGRQLFHLDASKTFFRPAAYVEAVWQATDRLTLVPGARTDYASDIDAWTFDPRLTARYQLGATTTLKGGAGLFSQLPDFGEELPVIGNPHLRPSHAQHYSLGVEQLAGERLKLTVEGFYKRLDHLSVNSPVPGENLNNDGIGRIYGGEVSARLRPTTKTSGFLSYTLSRSERNDHGTGWRLFNWDQTHILTIAGAYRLGRGWDLSGTFRYVTGNPLTPVAASVYDANTDTYKPIYGAVNSARSNDFHRVDLRIEKTWRVKSAAVAAYLDVQNAYNRHNEEGRVYNYNFTQSGVISGLPILPTLGLRGEL